MRILCQSIIVLFFSFISSPLFSQGNCDNTIPIFGLELQIEGPTPGDPNIYPGDEFCVHLIASNFDTLNLIQFALGFDPNIIEFLDPTQNGITNPETGSNLAGSVDGNIECVSKGILNIIWTNPFGGEDNSLADGEIFATICFEAKNTPGECTSLFKVDGTVFTPPLAELVEVQLSDDPSDPNEKCTMDSIAFNILNTEICIGCKNVIPSDLNICNSTGCVSFNACSEFFPVQWTISPFSPPTGPMCNNFMLTSDDTALKCNLPSGEYLLEMMDAMGNASSPLIFEIDQTIPEIRIDTTVTNPTCSEWTNGEIEYNISGGQGPYSVRLSTGIVFEETLDTFTGLATGIYTIEVSDDTGCTANLDNIILDTPPIELFAESDTFACLFAKDGQLRAKASGGTPFPGGQYEFNNMLSDCYVKDNPMGSIGRFDDEDTCYTIIVKDSRGCQLRECVKIPLRTVLPIQFDTMPPDCNSDGYSSSIQLINWTPIGRFQASLTGGSGFEPSAAGGVCAWAGYSDPCAPQANNTAFLQPGNYRWTVSILDSMDLTVLCTESIDFTIPDFILAPLEITATTTQPDCGSDNGSATLIVTGGNPPYSFQWDFDPSLDQSSASNLSSGIYPVTVIDDTGCEKDTFVDLEQGVFLTIEAMIVEDLDCGDPTKQAELGVTFSGFPATELIFNWYTENEAGLSPIPTLLTDTAGIYIIEVETVSGSCMVTDTIEITAPGNITYDAPVVVNPASCDLTNPIPGSIRIENIQGGSGIYLCFWKLNGIDLPPVTNFDCERTNLGPGEYEITIIDNNTGCSAVETFFLANDDKVEFTVTPTLPSCPETADGIIAIVGEIGGPLLSCTWDDPSITTTSCVATNLEAGEYLVNIRDENGCNKDTTITLASPEIFTAEISSTSAVACFEGMDGEAVVTVTSNPGNFLTYGYVWSNGDANSSALTDTNTNLSAGANTVIITDGNDCPVTLDFDIAEPDQLTLTTVSKTAITLCAGECNADITLEAVGGTAATGLYSYEWELDGSTSNTRNDLCAGVYPILITDDNGCEFTDTLFVSDPLELLIVLSTVNIGCQDTGAGGSITVEATGGCGGYLYNWTQNVSDNAIAMALEPGSYGVTVTDACGCTQMQEAIVEGDIPISADTLITGKIACQGETVCLGINPNTISGGTGLNYTFTIGSSNRIPIDSCVQVLPGPHAISVFDSEGCQLDLGLINVPGPEPFTVDLGPDIDLDIGDTAIELVAEIVSKTTIVNINWETLDSFECLGVLPCESISYNPTRNETVVVTIVDENGCIAMDEIMLNVTTPRRVYRPTVFDPSSDIDDKFMLLTGRGVERIEDFVVFDRWGNIVYTLDEDKKDFPHSKDDGWDGRKDNRNCESGVYVWIANIKFVDGQTLHYNGQVTLIR